MLKNVVFSFSLIINAIAVVWLLKAEHYPEPITPSQNSLPSEKQTSALCQANITQLHDYGLRLNEIIEKKLIESFCFHGDVTFASEEKSIVLKSAAMLQKQQHDVSRLLIQLGASLDNASMPTYYRIVSESDAQLPYLYDSYMGATRHWLQRSPSLAHNYLFEETVDWAGPAAVAGHELRTLAAQYRFQQHAQLDLGWIATLTSSLAKTKAYAAALDAAVIESRLNEFAEALLNNLEPAVAIETVTDFVTIYTEWEPMTAMEWVPRIPEREVRYPAMIAFFTTLGETYPYVGVQLFNQARNDRSIFNASNRYVSSGESENDAVAAYIRGLLNNRESSSHPAEVVAAVTAPYFRSKLRHEFVEQFRQRFPTLVPSLAKVMEL